MKAGIKQKIGALVLDAPGYVYLLLKSTFTRSPSWLQIHNRDERLLLNNDHVGIKCDWVWTSNLYLPKLFPFFGQALFRYALDSCPIRITHPKEAHNQDVIDTPQVSFIIGHRGSTRADLLLKTIESIASQRDCDVECIVVEQDNRPLIKDTLPDWVRYVFTPLENSEAPYSRSWAFNVGAEHAHSDCLIFHDNDLLVPSNYACETFKHFSNGFDFINLKRFIFYLTQDSTRELCGGAKLSAELKLESIMQNAQGGGSIGASRDSFNQIGKFDERFLGWGGEDSEFWERASTLRVWSYAYLPLVHLWHPNQTEKNAAQGLDKNHLYWKLQAKSPSQRIESLALRMSMHSGNPVK